MKNLTARFKTGTPNAHLHRSLLIFGILGILFTSFAVGMVGILPLSLKLKSNIENYISTAASTKAEVVSARLTDLMNVVDQIASRSAVRDQLVAYSKGNVTRAALIAFSSPKMADALSQSQALAGIQQSDGQGNLLLQVGQPVPAEFSALFNIPGAFPPDHTIRPVKIQDELFLLVCHGIVDETNQRVGSDLILFRTGEFQKVVNDASALGASAVVAIEQAQPAGFEILLNSRALTASESAFHRQALERLAQRKIHFYIPENSLISIAAAQVDVTGWYTTVQLDESELYAETNAQVFGLIGLALLLAVSGAIGFSVLLKPLTQGILVHEKELERLVIEKADQYQAEYEERMAIEHDLRALNSRYQSVVQSARDAVILTDRQGIIMDWNTAAETILGYTAHEMIGQSMLAIFPTRTQSDVMSNFQAFLADPGAIQPYSRAQSITQRKDGSEFPADITLSLFEIDGDCFVAGILRDNSELRAVENALKQSQARYKSLIEDVMDASSVAICITDPQLKIVWENQAAVTLWDLDRAAIIGENKRGLLQKRIADQIEDGDAFTQKVLESYDTDQHLENVELHFLEKPGKGERWLSYSSKPIRSGYYAGGRIEQYVDISELNRLMTRIEQLAVTDELTEIYNRRGLFELGRRDLARASRSGRPLSCVFLDIDHFKELNDRYGHSLGDQVLKLVAESLQAHTRDMDLIARYGGDEFVVLLPDTGLEQAYQIAERIRALVASAPFQATGTMLPVTISVGVALYSQGEDLPGLLKRADQAMYQAKRTGRNRVELSQAGD